MPDRSTRSFGVLRVFARALQSRRDPHSQLNRLEYPRKSSLTYVSLVNYASRRNCECTIETQTGKALRSKPVFTKEVAA